MGKTNFDQRFGTFDISRGNYCLHRKLHRLALLAIEQILIPAIQV
jgi:hypothetical protein